MELSIFVRVFFFFKQKTAYDITVRDWSSDVCSSDLGARVPERYVQLGVGMERAARHVGRADGAPHVVHERGLGVHVDVLVAPAAARGGEPREREARVSAEDLELGEE